MSEQKPTPQWRGRPDVMEHCFWSEFKNGLGDIGLITKFKGKGDGFEPENYGPFELDGLVYSAVPKLSKANKQYFDVERRPKNAPQQTPTSPTQTSQAQADKDEGWKKGHAENVAMHKEIMEALGKLTDAINTNTTQQKINGVVLDEIRMHTEVLAKTETARSSVNPTQCGQH